EGVPSGHHHGEGHPGGGRAGKTLEQQVCSDCVVDGDETGAADRSIGHAKRLVSGGGECRGVLEGVRSSIAGGEQIGGGRKCRRGIGRGELDLALVASGNVAKDVVRDDLKPERIASERRRRRLDFEAHRRTSRNGDRPADAAYCRASTFDSLTPCRLE